MPPSNVTRVADANVAHLENEIPFNGSFRLFIFQGLSHYKRKSSALSDLAAALLTPKSFYSRHASQSQHQNDNHHERHNPHTPFFSVALVVPTYRPEIEVADLHPFFRNYSDHIYADDIWDQRVPDATAAAHAKVGLEQDGGVVVVRPDGHVACCVGLVEGRGTVDALEEYFAGFVAESGAGTEGESSTGRGTGLGGQEAIVRANL